jgi:hypothetical protein
VLTVSIVYSVCAAALMVWSTLLGRRSGLKTHARTAAVPAHCKRETVDGCFGDVSCPYAPKAESRAYRANQKEKDAHENHRSRNPRLFTHFVRFCC